MSLSNWLLFTVNHLASGSCDDVLGFFFSRPSVKKEKLVTVAVTQSWSVRWGMRDTKTSGADRWNQQSHQERWQLLSASSPNSNGFQEQIVERYSGNIPGNHLIRRGLNYLNHQQVSVSDELKTMLERQLRKLLGGQAHANPLQKNVIWIRKASVKTSLRFLQIELRAA